MLIDGYSCFVSKKSHETRPTKQTVFAVTLLLATKPSAKCMSTRQTQGIAVWQRILVSF